MNTVTVETKPGVKTTEFWLTILINLVAFLNLIGVWNYVPNRYSALVMTVVTSAYMLSRGQAKSGVPTTEVVAANGMRATPPTNTP